jgi:uncharacterized integral membrane protein
MDADFQTGSSFLFLIIIMIFILIVNRKRNFSLFIDREFVPENVPVLSQSFCGEGGKD